MVEMRALQDQQIHNTFHRNVYKKSRRRLIRSSKKLTRMLFFTSIYFLVTTLPVSILNVADWFVKDPDNNLILFFKNVVFACRICAFVHITSFYQTVCPEEM
jgi:hypothetical protein